MCSRALATVFIIYCLNTGFCEELFELSCSSDSDCEHFRQTGLNVTCLGKECVCETIDNRQRIGCKPTDLMQNNIIGGYCPCPMENALCDTTSKTCLCEAGFIASYDKRRCIHKSVPLGDLCEDNSQCLSHDHFSVCDPNKKSCVCLELHVEHDRKCLSTVALHVENCDVNIQCDNHTSNSICSEKKCVCEHGFTANILKTSCLPNSGHHEICTETNQCKATLGAGAVCDGGMCTCSSDYYAANVTTDGTQHIKCQKKPVIGDYCRNNADCTHIGMENVDIECIAASCRCIPSENNNCPLSGGESHSHAMFGYLFLMLVLHLNFIYMVL